MPPESRVDDDFEWAIYARLSDNKNGTAGSAKRQERVNRKAALRLGGKVVRAFIDDDFSAYDKSNKFKPRPDYQALLSFVAEKPGKRGIIAWHTDRLWRTPREFEDFLDLDEQCDVLVYLEQSGFLDLKTADGRAEARSKVNSARRESEHRSQRVKAGKVENAEEGRINGGGERPFGYERHFAELGHRRVILGESLNEAEAAVIRQMKDMLLVDGKSLYTVTQWLNGAGWHTVRGRRFSVSTVRGLMASARIAGLRSHLGEVVGPAVWPKIIDPEEHDQLRKLLGTKSSKGTGSRRKYWLTGRVYCTDCVVRDVRMYPYTKYGRVKYRCSPAAGGCNGRQIDLHELQSFVGRFVAARLRDPETARLLAEREASAATQTQEIMGRISADERRAEVLAGTLDGADDDDIPEVVSMLRKVRQRLADTRAELAALSGVRPLRDSLPDLAARWESGDLDLAEKYELCGLVVDKVLVGPGARSPKFDPRRVDIVHAIHHF